MNTPKVYVLCDQNCKFEGMTKEQILTAIMQAVESGTVGDIDTGFITTIKTVNNVAIKFFYGEQWAYDALSDSDKENLIPWITNDTELANIRTAIDSLNAKMENIQISSASLVIKPEVKTSKRLTKRGHYSISCLCEGVMHSFGVVYWANNGYPTMAAKTNTAALQINADGTLNITGEYASSNVTYYVAEVGTYE